MDCTSDSGDGDSNSTKEGGVTSDAASRLNSKLEELRSVLLNEQSSTRVVKDIDSSHYSISRTEVTDTTVEIPFSEAEECSLEDEGYHLTMTPEPVSEPCDTPKDKYALNENNRDGCYVCNDIIFGNTTVNEICENDVTPNFLQSPKVDWRIRHELNMASSAWKKIVEEVKKAPYVEEVKSEESKPCAVEVKEPDENPEDDSLAVGEVKNNESEVPVVEEPGVVKRFPLTRETRKKHIEKETVMKKEEKREAVLMLRKKQEELRKLKEAYRRQAQKQHCHKEERKAEYERKKLEYLENLAKERKVDLDILKKHGDEIYGKYRKECKLSDEIKERKLEEEIAIVEKLLREEKMKEKLEEDEFPTEVSKKALPTSRSLQTKNTNSTEVEKEILEQFMTPLQEPQYRTGSAISLPKEVENIEKLNVTPVTRASSRKTQSTVKPIKVHSKLPSQLKSKYKTLTISQTDKLSGIKRLRHTSQQSRSYMIRRFSQYVPQVEELKSLIDSEFLNELNDLQQVWNTISGFKKEDDSPHYKDDDGIGVSPKTIIFHDFFPAQTQLEKVKIYNKTKSEVTFGIYNILIEPVYDGRIISVWPPEATRLWPGECGSVEVLFSPIEWGTVEEIKARLWFWTRHRDEGRQKDIQDKGKQDNLRGEVRQKDIRDEERQKDIRDEERRKDIRVGRFCVDVTCLRACSNPVVVQRTIDFPEVDWRNHKVYTKNLVIENRGALSCTVYIHRSFELNIPPENESPSSTSFQAKTTLNKGNNTKIAGLESNLRLDGPKKKGSGSLASRQKNNLELETLKSRLFITSLLNVLLEEVCSPFRVSLTRGRHIDGYTATIIPIKFAPYMVEDTFVAEDFISITFEGPDSWTRKEVVRLTGSLLRPPIEVEPSILDMSVLIIDGRCQQKSFFVRNKTEKFTNVKINIPKDLQKHFQVVPSYFMLRPHSENKIIVKARLGLSLCQDSLEYLFEDASILEFKIDVEPENRPPVQVAVLATVAEALGLRIEPDFVDLRVVNTTETAVHEFWISNHTLVAHDIAFLNVPKWGMIMPDYGFTTIPPCESRRFELLYSPSWTEAGKPGGQAEHTFTLKCTTLQVVSSYPNMKNLSVEEKVRNLTEEELKAFQELKPLDNYPENAIKENSKSSEKSGKMYYKDEDEEEEEKESKENTKEEEEEEEEAVEDKESYSFLFGKLSDYQIANPADKSAQSMKKKQQPSKQPSKQPNKVPLPQQKNELIKPEVADESEKLITQNEVVPGAPCPPTPELYTFIRCRAVVVDPICQLSQQKIVLPATPITSYSVSKVFLSCPSEASGHSCDCGIFKSLETDPRARVKARFQFIWDDPYLQIEPSMGDLSYGEKITVRIYFNPDITEEDIKNGENLLRSQNYKLFRQRKSKTKVKRKSGMTIVWSSSGSLKGDDNDKYNLVKMEVLKRLKQRVNQVGVKCLIETKMTEAPFTMRTEVLNCIIVCTTVRPDFFLRAPKRDNILEFPMTGVGLTKEQKIEIHNISRRTIFLTRNLLDINDVFYTTMIPGYNSALPRGPGRGLMLEPEQYTTIKVIYAPEKAGEDIDYMEFRSNLTRVRYKLRGEAKNPSFKVHPQFAWAVMEVFPGQRIEETITVTNTGEVPINFRITSLYEKESINFLYEDPDVQLNVFNRKAVPSRSVKKCQLINNINNWIVNAIDDRFTECKLQCPILVEPRRLILEQGKRGKIKIIFNTSSKMMGNKLNVSRSTDLNKSEKTPVLYENDPERIPEVEPTSFAKCVLLTFGAKNIVATWTILAFVKRKQIKTDKRALGSLTSTARSTNLLKHSISKLKKDGHGNETIQGKYVISDTLCYSDNSENEVDNSCNFNDKIETSSVNDSVIAEKYDHTVLHEDKSEDSLDDTIICRSMNTFSRTKSDHT